MKLELDKSGEYAAQLRQRKWERLWEKYQAWDCNRGLGSGSRGPGEDVCAIQLPWLQYLFGASLFRARRLLPPASALFRFGLR